MANKKFLIVDDDINICKMLAYLIKKNNLGRVVEELHSGQYAVDEILLFNPDIVLIDLLLPYKDGIEIINLARGRGFKGKFIMISQVEDANMISKAYQSGIIFFINKPINNIEAFNVIKGVCKTIDLEQSVALIKNAVLDIKVPSDVVTPLEESLNSQITKIFKDLGITGETGSNELKKLLFKIIKIKQISPNQKYQLQRLYESIAEEASFNNNISISKRSIEKRIRRVIQKALRNLAAHGYDDYYSLKFTEYSSLLFNYKQVKQEIKYIDNPNLEHGKISIKKFLEGFIAKLKY